MCAQQFIAWMKEWLPVIQAFGSIATVGAVVAAVVSSAAARRSSLAAEKSSDAARTQIELANRTLKTQRLNALLDNRYDMTTFRAKRFLRAWYDEWKDKQGDFTAEFVAKAKRDAKWEGNEYRNHFIMYLIKVHDLFKEGIIRNEELGTLVNSGDLALLFTVLKPIEAAIHQGLLTYNGDDTEETDDLLIFYKQKHREGFIK